MVNFKHLKTFELFGFGKKKEKTWQEKFDEIYNFYQKNKNSNKKIDILEEPYISINDKSFGVAKGNIHIHIYGEGKGNRNMEVVDFEVADYANPKSQKGVYPISKEEYDKYFKKCQEISDWLDDMSDKEFGKSDSSISDTGDLNIEIDEVDLELEVLCDKIKKELNIIGKEFEFEMAYHLWTSGSTNKLTIERRMLKISDLKISYGGSRFYAEIFTNDPAGDKAKIWLESDSNSEYYDLEKNKWPYDNKSTIRMSTVRNEMTRKEEREFEKNRKYPYAFSYDITPSKWNSMEFIKSITEILNNLNLGITKV